MSKPKPIRFFNRANRDLHCEERYRQLCADARLVLMHLILCRETTPLPGLVRIRRSTLIEDLPMTPRRFKAAWSQLEASAYVKADWDAGLVWLVDGLDHNPPENPNTVRGWSKHLPLLPHCALRIEAQQEILVSLSRRGQGFAESAREVLENGGMVSTGFGEPGAGSGSGSGSGTKTGEGECVGSASPSPKPESPPPPFSNLEETKNEKPARVANPVKAPMPEGWTLSAEYVARLEVTYHRRDIEAQIARFPGKAKSKAWTSADWNEEFVSFIEREAGWGNVTPKPPPRQPKPAAPAAPAPQRRTPEEQEAWTAQLEREIGPLTPTPEPGAPLMPADITDLLHSGAEPEASSEWPDVGETGFAAALAKTRGAKAANDESESA